MSKTITIRLDDNTYELIRKAAEGERRSISNFVEYATVAHLSEEAFVPDSEMGEILANRELIGECKRRRTEIGKKRYTMVQ